MEQNIAIDYTSADGDRTADRADGLYMCIVCGWIYDESKGLPEAGIPPGKRWEDVPEEFLCLECGESKEAFERVEA